LIIKKKRNIITKNSIGKLFRKYNLIEFKSPKDELNFDTQEEKDMACEALRELFKPELEEATQEGNKYDKYRICISEEK
jgi:hypothetical protein